jgi:hypothetical protein
MDLTTTLDVDLVAVETAGEVAVLLDLSAPALAADARPPQTLEIELDRSGSMAGDRSSRGWTRPTRSASSRSTTTSRSSCPPGRSTTRRRRSARSGRWSPVA